MLYPEIVVAGCGNPLYADDGFGPAVAEALRVISFSGSVRVLDAGTSGPGVVFPLLDPEITKHLLVIDIADFGAKPGSLALLRPGDFPRAGLRDVHSGGIIGSLRGLAGIDVAIIVCQPGRVTDPVMEIGLSDAVMDAIPRTIRLVRDLVGEAQGIVPEPFPENCPEPAGYAGVNPDNLNCTILKPAGRIRGSI